MNTGKENKPFYRFIITGLLAVTFVIVSLISINSHADEFYDDQWMYDHACMEKVCKYNQCEWVVILDCQRCWKTKDCKLDGDRCTREYCDQESYTCKVKQVDYCEKDHDDDDDGKHKDDDDDDGDYGDEDDDDGEHEDEDDGGYGDGDGDGDGKEHDPNITISSPEPEAGVEDETIEDIEAGEIIETALEDMASDAAADLSSGCQLNRSETSPLKLWYMAFWMLPILVARIVGLDQLH